MRELNQYQIHALIITILLVLILICFFGWYNAFKNHKKKTAWEYFSLSLRNYFLNLNPNLIGGARQHIIHRMITHVEDYKYLFHTYGREAVISRCILDLKHEYQKAEKTRAYQFKKREEELYNEFKSKNQGTTPEA